MTIAISRPVMMLKRLIFLRNTAASAVLTLRAVSRKVNTPRGDDRTVRLAPLARDGTRDLSWSTVDSRMDTRKETGDREM